MRASVFEVSICEIKDGLRDLILGDECECDEGVGFRCPQCRIRGALHGLTSAHSRGVRDGLERAAEIADSYSHVSNGAEAAAEAIRAEASKLDGEEGQ